MMLAHYDQVSQRTHDLYQHLEDVAQLASSFATFDTMQLTKTAASLHDIGKEQQAFQQYLKNPNGKRGSVWHALPGATLIYQYRTQHKLIAPNFVLLALLENMIAGHHRGLYDMESDWPKKFEGIVFSSAYGEGIIHRYCEVLANMNVPSEFLYLETLTRFSFSALVDADWLDTEKAMNSTQAHHRSQQAFNFRYFQNKFRQYLERQPLQPKLSHYRMQAEQAGSEPTRFRTLHLPTGYGKTYASMDYALAHATTFHKSRIIVALPLLNLTAEVSALYRKVMGKENVIEDYSLASNANAGEESSSSKLTTENWDAPFIITTTVQLFESLFSNQPRKVRKLHRLANSIIILDEYHLLPPHLMAPIFRMLDVLQRHFNVTVLFVSATKLPFATSEIIKNWGLDTMPQPITEQVEPPHKVQYHLLDKLTTQELAQSIDERATLIIVNTRKQAQAVYAQLKVMHPERQTYYLTTTLVGRDRKARLTSIKSSLDKRPIVVATSLVEAGVDISFEVVYRELAPLASIIQAAGRCNRYYEKPQGDVYLFEWQTPTRQSPVVEAGVAQVKTLLAKYGEAVFFNDQALGEAYCRLLSNEERNNPLPENTFLFETTAARFNMIDVTTVDVICPQVNGFPHQLLTAPRTKQWWRALQAFTVPLPASMKGVTRNGDIWIWRGAYDEAMGVSLKGGEEQ